MEDNSIANSQLSASSQTGGHPVEYGRLNGGKAWKAEDKSNDQKPWIQVHFLQLTFVAGIATQGKADGGQNEWVTEYNVVAFNKENGTWELMKNSNEDIVSLIVSLLVSLLSVLCNGKQNKKSKWTNTFPFA